MKSVAVGLASLLLTLSGCADDGPLDGAKVDPKSVWVEFAAEWQESSDRVGLSAQFRLKGAGGQVIKLGKGASVALSGPDLALAASDAQPIGFGYDRSGQSYTLNLPMPEAKATEEALQVGSETPLLREQTFNVVWQQSKERVAKVDLTVSQAPSIETERLDLQIKRSVGLAVRFVPLDDSKRGALLSEEIRCELRSTATVTQPAQAAEETPGVEQPEGQDGSSERTAAPEVVTKVAVAAKRRDGCAFDSAALRSFALGPAELSVVAEQVRPVPPLPARGGRIGTRAVSRPVGFVVTDSSQP